MKYNEGDLVVCKVKNIVKTAVFTETIDGTKGSIVLSEVAPGRIRNLRVYVVPNKVIVCKILNIKDGHLFLSLRRVKEKERKEFISRYKKEKTYESVIRELLGKKADEVLKKITSTQTLQEFLDEARQNQKILEKYFSKNEYEIIGKLIKDKKDKDREVKKEFKLSCAAPNGIIVIKELLRDFDGIVYLGSSKFSIKRMSSDPKKTDSEIREFLEKLEKNARKNKCEFEVLKS